jgi:hypothetical protein
MLCRSPDIGFVSKFGGLKLSKVQTLAPDRYTRPPSLVSGVEVHTLETGVVVLRAAFIVLVLSLIRNTKIAPAIVQTVTRAVVHQPVISHAKKLSVKLDRGPAFRTLDVNRMGLHPSRPIPLAHKGRVSRVDHGNIPFGQGNVSDIAFDPHRAKRLRLSAALPLFDVIVVRGGHLIPMKSERASCDVLV